MDYIVKVDHKFNDKVILITKYKRTTTYWGVGPNAKYEEMNRQNFLYVPSDWKEVGYEAEITLRPNELNDDQAHNGLRQLYVYDEDVVMQNGGKKYRKSYKLRKMRKGRKAFRKQTRRYK